MLITNQAAERIAQKSADKVGFAWMTLIPIIVELLPMIIKCFQPDNAEQAKAYLNKRYSAEDSGNKYGGYKKQLVVDVARRAKRAAKRKGESLSFEQAIVVAIDTLNEARESDSQTVGTCISEGDALIASGAVQD